MGGSAEGALAASQTVARTVTAGRQVSYRVRCVDRFGNVVVRSVEQLEARGVRLRVADPLGQPVPVTADVDPVSGTATFTFTPTTADVPGSGEAGEAAAPACHVLSLEHNGQAVRDV
eukprot:tig00000475_g1246.t1